MLEFIYNKFLKLGKKINKGPVEKFFDTVNDDPEAGWWFLTTVLLIGGFGVGLCILWFYLMLVQGMPVWAIIFDSAIIIFCAWAIIKGVIPMSKEAYRINNEKRKKKEEDYVDRERN